MDRKQEATQTRVSDEYDEFFRTSLRRLAAVVMRVHSDASVEEAKLAAAYALEEAHREERGCKVPFGWLSRVALNHFVKGRVRTPHRVAERMHERGLANSEAVEDVNLVRFEDDEWTDQLFTCLTARQRQVMQCVAAGINHLDIPEMLGMTPELVRRHLCDGRVRLTAELRRRANVGWAFEMELTFPKEGVK